MPTEDAECRSGSDDHSEEEIGAHLAEVADGCGCTEVWEHLSGHRE